MITVNSRESFLEAVKGYLSENPIIAELGVLQGDFSEMIFKALKPEALFLIDPFEIGKETYGKEFNNQPTAYSTESDYNKLMERLMNNEAFLKTAIIYKDYSYDRVHKFRRSVFDFIYHDASHEYEDIKRDLREWLPKLKEHGIMAGHDYVNLNGFGVIQAVDEFCKEHNFEMILFNSNGGDYALKRK